jgi:hypothetical protein
MARRIQSLAVAAAAVATSAALVAAVPAPQSAAYTPTRLSTAKYELTAISDITINGIAKAYWGGYGGYIGVDNGTPDPYYPGINSSGTKPVLAAGVPGVLYYLSDNIITTFLPTFNLQNYYFETAQVFGAGLPAVFYVGASEYIPGGGTIVSIIQNAVPLAQAAFVSATGILPKVNIGPVTIGGSILSSLYFYGATPAALDSTVHGPNYDYNSSSNNPGGLSAIWGYVSTSLNGGVPSTAAIPAAATSLSAASTLAKATAATNTGGPKLLALASGNASATASDPITGFISFFVGNGTAEHPNGGLLAGNGYSYGTVAGDCPSGGCNGGNAGFFFGKGGNGANGVDSYFDAEDKFVAATPGGDGGHGGLFIGSGGAGGAGGSDLLDAVGFGSGAYGGAGGNAGLLYGNGGAGGAGGDGFSAGRDAAGNGGAVGGDGGSGGSSGIVGDGGPGGAGGNAEATSTSAADYVDGGYGGNGGNSTFGTAGKGGTGGDATGHDKANAYASPGGNGGSSTVGTGGDGGAGGNANAVDGDSSGAYGGDGGNVVVGTAGSGGQGGSSTKPVGSTTGQNVGGDGGYGGNGFAFSRGGNGAKGGDAVGGGKSPTFGTPPTQNPAGGYGGVAGSGGIGGKSGTAGADGTPTPPAKSAAAAAAKSSAAKAGSASSSTN